MADRDILVESVELALRSGIGMSSATLMKDAYLPPAGGESGGAGHAPCLQPGDFPLGEGSAGPDALVYITKLSSRTSDDVVELLLRTDPDQRKTMGTHDFFTLILTMSIQMGDPSTTRFINGTFEVTFRPDVKILTYSPKDKGIITAIIENGGDTISLSRDLVFHAPIIATNKNQHDPEENRFAIMIGQDEKISGTYRKKTGYSLDIPASTLLEYQGMFKNRHELVWEIYPPMPPADLMIPGNRMLAVFSQVIQIPKNSLPEIIITIEGRVKGNLWGVVPVRGSVILT